VTFDPFGDFESRGYLRNFASLKDISQVKDLEYASFQGNLSRAINALAAIDFIEYKHVLAIHKTLFGDVYPWAGRDRLLTALTKELNDPEQGHLDLYLKPFIRDAVERQQSTSVLKSLKGLGETTTPPDWPDRQGGALGDRDSGEC
jgi:fido (protein-threonine AMPylation protein)